VREKESRRPRVGVPFFVSAENPPLRCAPKVSRRRCARATEPLRGPMSSCPIDTG
jgi:hypothetical protein